MTFSMSALDARRYTLDDLLEMRESLPVVHCVIKNINSDADLSSISRIPGEAFNDPEHFVCFSQSLSDIANRQKLTSANKRENPTSSEDSESQLVSEKLGHEGSAQVQWNFRRRDSSDRSSQPHSAPTGIAAQQSENFQRFYRAVVSPTHVRVTAGGRIVPNTRISANPPLELSSDKFQFEPRKVVSDFERNPPLTSWLHGTSLSPSTFFPPYNFVSQGSTFAMPTMAPTFQQGLSVNDISSMENTQPQNINGEIPGGQVHPGSMLQPIKISPPTQFDQTKPFILNGHVVYPVPLGFQPPPSAFSVPISVIGNPGFATHNQTPALTGFLPSQYPVPLSSLTNHLMFPASPQPPMLMQNTVASSENSSTVPSYLPVPATVPFTEFLNSQIQVLQANLRALESQMVNQNNQLDNTFMEHQRASLVAQINHTQATLKSQLAQGGDPNNVTGSGTLNRTNSVPNFQEYQRPGSIKTPRATEAGSARQISSIISENMLPHQIPKTEATKFPYTVSDVKSTAKSEPAGKSRLTMAAAMAPPFQPRSQSAISQAHRLQPAEAITNTVDISSPGDAPFQTQDQIEKRLLAKSSSDWGPSTNMAANKASSLSRVSTAHGATIQTQSASQPPPLPRFHTFHGHSAISSDIPQNSVKLSTEPVPYLVGTLPHGINTSFARSTDLVYSRPLTDDEIRARYLYWGKAPHSIQSGLPKFDGKDFYPPSPVKSNRVELHSSDGSSTIDQIKSSSSDPCFEGLFEPEADGHKVVPSSCTTQDRRARMPPPKLRFENSTHGHNPAESARSSEEPTHFIRDEGVPNHPSTPPVRAGSKICSAEDFSHLFLERGVPGYKTPSPLRLDNRTSQRCGEREEIPVTPRKIESDFTERQNEDEVLSIGSWGNPSPDTQRIENESGSLALPSPGTDVQSTSTVEIHLSPQNKNRSHKPMYESSFAERVENFRSAEQQTLFLQNMLKNTTQTPMMGSASSGSISSATAQGYLPQYRGTAAASLAPAMLNVSIGERDTERELGKDDVGKDAPILAAPILAANYLPENRPLNQECSHQVGRSSTENPSAARYLRYVGQKDNGDKEINHDWSPKMRRW